LIAPSLFPVSFHLLGLTIPAHLLFESLAYTIGFQLWLRTRHRWDHVPLPFEKNIWVIIGCIFGALIGSKLLNIADSPLQYWAHRGDLLFWLQGKTVVGGLLGGWAGVELVKKRLGISYATGDAYVFPLIVGIVVGRVGCFIEGPHDATFGIPTTLAWGVDFGDGVPRHPAQLYEILFLLLFAGGLLLRMRRRYPNGWLFRAFMLGYLLFRFVVEFIKPREVHYLGLSGIQLAALAGAAYSAVLLYRLHHARKGA